MGKVDAIEDGFCKAHSGLTTRITDVKWLLGIMILVVLGFFGSQMITLSRIAEIEKQAAVIASKVGLFEKHVNGGTH